MERWSDIAVAALALVSMGIYTINKPEKKA